MQPVSERERVNINTSLKTYRHYSDVFPSFDEYIILVKSIELEMLDVDKLIVFGIEKYKEEFNYFNINLS